MSTLGERPSSPSEDESMTVLLVDDDRDQALRYGQHLRSHGLRVVQDGDRSADLLMPDVVVYGTPACGTHGAAVRVVAHGRPVPIIAISDDERDRAQASSLGFASVLIRPFNLDLLLLELQRLGAAQAPSIRSPGVDDPEYTKAKSAIQRRERQEIRDVCQQSRARLRDLRSVSQRLRQKSSDLLRQSDAMVSPSHRRR